MDVIKLIKEAQASSDSKNTMENALSITLLGLLQELKDATDLNSNDIMVNTLYDDDIFLAPILRKKERKRKHRKGKYMKIVSKTIIEVCRTIQFNNSDKSVDDLSRWKKLKGRM